MKRLELIFVVLLLNSLVLSTPLVFGSSVMWSQTYGGTRETEARAMVQTPDGGYAMAGWTILPDAYHRDFWLVKTDANGIKEWNQTYGGVEDDLAFSLVQTTDGGYALSGYTLSFATDYKNSWLVKVDEQTLIPEFPLWTILPLVLTITLFSVVVKRKLYTVKVS